jgi:hypothetical protein
LKKWISTWTTVVQLRAVMSFSDAIGGDHRMGRLYL